MAEIANVSVTCLIVMIQVYYVPEGGEENYKAQNWLVSE